MSKEILLNKIQEGIGELMHSSFNCSMSQLNHQIHHGTSKELDAKEKLIESKVNSMKRLKDNIELSLISHDDAKTELMRIMHGTANVQEPSQ